MHVSARLTARGAAALAALALVAPAARAQNPAAVAQVPNTVEIGADAGLTFGLGDQSSIDFAFPAQRARVGFFLNNDSRISVEPSVGFTYGKTENAPGVSQYTLETGVLYHFRPARLITDVANRAAVSYARPFVGFEGQSVGGGGRNDNEFFVGAGLGVKVPVRTNIALRAEANLGYGFDNEAARVGATLGLSFFTRRAR
jgi:hypothetical protein